MIPSHAHVILLKLDKWRLALFFILSDHFGIINETSSILGWGRVRDRPYNHTKIEPWMTWSGRERWKQTTSVIEPAHACDHAHQKHAQLIMLFHAPDHYLVPSHNFPFIKYLCMPNRAMNQWECYHFRNFHLFKLLMNSYSSNVKRVIKKNN